MWSTMVSSSLSHKHQARLKRLVCEKHPRLLGTFVNYEEKRFYNIVCRSRDQPRNTKSGSVTVPLTSSFTGLDKSVLKIKTEIVSCHTTDSKPVKQEVNGTMILPPLVFPGQTFVNYEEKKFYNIWPRSTGMYRCEVTAVVRQKGFPGIQEIVMKESINRMTVVGKTFRLWRRDVQSNDTQESEE